MAVTAWGQPPSRVVVMVRGSPVEDRANAVMPNW
jgi:hypothetical protein